MKEEVNTIFIVDDDQTQSMMLKDYLNTSNSFFKIHSFQSGEECLKNLNLNPEVIFLDYNFDKVGPFAMNGTDILKEIKSQRPETEVVMISGQDKIEVAVNTMKYGAFDYIVKGETAFHRSENAIFNIVRQFKLKADARLYKRLTYAFAAAFVIMIIIVAVLYKTGKITNNPGWL